MAFSPDNIRRVREDFRVRRAEAAAAAEAAKTALYAEIPALAPLDREISSVGVRVMRAAIAGGDVEAAVAKMKEEHAALRARRAALLAAHGYAPDATDIRYRCERCLDTGFVGTRMCVCMREALIRAGCESSGLGALLDRQTFDSFSLDYYRGDDRRAMEKNVAALRDFAAHFEERRGENYLLIGATGLGKTHLSTAVAGAVIAAGGDVVYVTAHEVFSAYEKTRFGEGEGGEDRFLSCDLLIVDDLGTELTNNFTLSCLYNLLNTRLNRRLSTILSTNLTPKELRARYADRITSRLFGEYRPLLFGGSDVRMQKIRASES